MFLSIPQGLGRSNQVSNMQSFGAHYDDHSTETTQKQRKTMKLWTWHLRLLHGAVMGSLQRHQRPKHILVGVRVLVPVPRFNRFISCCRYFIRSLLHSLIRR